MRRKLPWQRDELILALDFYFKYGELCKTDDRVKELTEIINKLPIYSDSDDNKSARSEDAIKMTLSNFLSVHTKKTEGLKHTSEAQKLIWKEFQSDRHRLAKLAQLIIRSLENTEVSINQLQHLDQDEEEFPEGKVLYRLHRTRERNKNLVKKAKKKRKEEVGKLDCDVCGFSFSDVYGEIGEDYIECHHIKPVSELDSDSTTKVNELALVCANCHRMLHRKRPWMAVEDLRSILISKQ